MTHESQALVERIVQLGVGVANLLLADESLEALAETEVISYCMILADILDLPWNITMVLGQW